MQCRRPPSLGRLNCPAGRLLRVFAGFLVLVNTGTTAAASGPKKLLLRRRFNRLHCLFSVYPIWSPTSKGQSCSVLEKQEWWTHPPLPHTRNRAGKKDRADATGGLRRSAWPLGTRAAFALSLIVGFRTNVRNSAPTATFLIGSSRDEKSAKEARRKRRRGFWQKRQTCSALRSLLSQTHALTWTPALTKDRRLYSYRSWLAFPDHGGVWMEAASPDGLEPKTSDKLGR
ncbi:hypothetical protein MRX96_056135 [Rhipicephalus microplus]